MTLLHPLLLAALLSFLAALLHVAIIFGGADWYRFFGAGETMAQMAETGSWTPTVITLGIVVLLILAGSYALAGAGLIGNLPFIKSALTIITSIYLLRGIAGFILPWFSQHPAVAQNSMTFWLVSSVICLGFGLVHLWGLSLRWSQIGI